MIRASGLTKYYPGHDEPAVEDVSFELLPGEMLCIVGKSGCGKSTTVKMLNRMTEPSSGTVQLHGKNIMEHDPVTVRRSMGYVPQGGALFPHWTVQKNIALVPGLLNWHNDRIQSRTIQLMELMDLPPARFLNKYPHELSGGQEQRVSLARALAADPEIILLDEPFSALDAITRKQLQGFFSDIKSQLDKIMIFVTHDLNEAFRMPDKLLIMDGGTTLQFDTPQAIRNRPANDTVRTLLNYLEA